MSMLWAVYAAATDAATVPFDITQLLQFGLLGLIFLCLVFRKFIVPEWTLKAAEARAAEDRADLHQRLEATQTQVRLLQETYEKQLIPALTRATEVNGRYADELQYARLSAKAGSTSSRETRP